MIFAAPSRRVRLLSAVLGSALAVTLAGCGSNDNSTSQPSGATPSASAPAVTPSATPSASASATPTKKPTALASIDQVAVTGKFGTMPTVKASYPFLVSKTESKVLQQGSGVTVKQGSVIEFNYLGINARTGKTFDSSWQKGRTTLTMKANELVTGFTKSVIGRHVGDRVLMVITSADGYPSGGGADIAAGDTIFFVVDLVSATLEHPTGSPVTVPSNLPQVTGGEGTPKVTIPKTAAPSKLTVQQVIRGTGKKIAAADTITVNYAVYDWATGREIASTYKTGTETGKLADLVPAWTKGLKDQPIGSRVLIVAPPADAYGSQGNATPSIAPNSTLVYVVDVLYGYIPQT